MKKILLTLLLLPVLNNCTQYSAMIGPSYTLLETGNILQASTSLSGSLAMNAAKKNFINEMEKVNICQTVHTSSLNEVFFETVEHMDCFYDPMSIYR
jgi:hypothetical protein